MARARLAIFFAEVADALHVSRHADGRNGLAKIDGERLPAGDRQDGALLDLPLEDVEAAVRCDHRLGERQIAPKKRRDGIDQHLFGDAAHLGDAAPQVLQVVVIGTDDVLRHGSPP